MADLEINNPEFDIVVNLDGTEKSLRIKPEETSDGVPYYGCYDGDSQVTQIRRDEDNNWDQMWGDLEQEEVEAIGQMITEKEM
jgi:hypothetical protein